MKTIDKDALYRECIKRIEKEALGKTAGGKDENYV
jgi:hypothetical protein